MRGGVGAEQSCAALGAPLPALLRAAADMLLSRGKMQPALYLYSLSQVRRTLFYTLYELISLDIITGACFNFGSMVLYYLSNKD